MNIALTKLLIIVSLIVLIGSIIAMYSPIISSIKGNIDYVRLLKNIGNKIVLSAGSGTEIIPSINFKNTNTKISFYNLYAGLQFSFPQIKIPWFEDDSFVEKELVAYELNISYNILCIEETGTTYSSNITPLRVFMEGEKISSYYEIGNITGDTLCLIPIINIVYSKASPTNLTVKVNIPVIRNISVSGYSVSSREIVLNSIYNIVVNTNAREITSLPYSYTYYGDVQTDLAVNLIIGDDIFTNNAFTANISKVEPNSTIYLHINLIETTIKFERE